jgi:hypothetical protein
LRQNTLRKRHTQCQGNQQYSEKQVVASMNYLDLKDMPASYPPHKSKALSSFLITSTLPGFKIFYSLILS